MHTFLTASSVLFDAIYLIGDSDVNNKFKQDALYFVNEAFSHYKPIGGTHEGLTWLKEAELIDHPGVVSGDDMKQFAKDFVQAISEHRHWDRQVNL